MISASDFATAFPEINPGVRPLGARVLVQLRVVRTTTESGLVLVNDTREFNKSVTQLAKVISLGPLAYRNRTDMQPWPEGVWVNPGSLVRVPRYGGDRFERRLHGDETVVFAMFADHEILSEVDMEAFTDLDEIL